MLIWRGYGLFVPVIIFFCGMSSEFFLEWLMNDDQYFQTHHHIRAASYGYASIFLYLVGKWLNKKTPGYHSFFFIPFEYWSIIIFLIGMVSVVTADL